MENQDLPKMFLEASAKIFQFAAQNRQQATIAEALLWNKLKNKQLKGYKFRRQHPMGSFILDFYCHSAKLGIEIDGAYHEKRLQKEYDEMRTESLNIAGDVVIVRFQNEEVVENIDEVLAKILIFLEDRTE